LLNCVKRDRKKEMNYWVRLLRENMILFADFRSRDWFLEQLHKLK
jgi:hypothetical protein